jgi:cobalt-zinc-cadmium efflux system membrane fusion protein
LSKIETLNVLPVAQARGNHMNARSTAAVSAVAGAVVAVLALSLLRIDVAQLPALGWQDNTVPGAEERHAHDRNNEEGRITLSDEQLRAAGIELASVSGGDLQKHFLVPGTIAPDANRVARVSVRVLGTVVELRKGIGDHVEAGEVVAVIESREVADAKTEYLAALPTNELQQTLAARLKALTETRALAENDYLRARLAAQDAKIRLDSARQKLFALGLSEAEIAGLASQPPEAMQKQYLRAPIGGRIAERRADLGALVGREGLESELFIIVNLDRVWVDLAVPPADLAKVRGNITIALSEATTGATAKAQIVFVSPLLDANTRSAKVVAAFDNPGHTWRPGIYVTAEIPVGGVPARVLVPKTAVQTIQGKPAVFVRTSEGFLARPVQIGREDDDRVEILTGLDVSETIAASNTFILKAELGKAEAQHEH